LNYIWNYEEINKWLLQIQPQRFSHSLSYLKFMFKFMIVIHWVRPKEICSLKSLASLSTDFEQDKPISPVFSQGYTGQNTYLETQFLSDLCSLYVCSCSKIFSHNVILSFDHLVLLFVLLVQVEKKIVTAIVRA
jgi:hypothetical protein